MKNIQKMSGRFLSLAKITALAVTVVFAAVSCAPHPQVEETPYNFANAIAQNDTSRNSSFNYEEFVPAFTKTKETTGTAGTGIISMSITAKFPIEADVLRRGAIAADNLNFLTFHTFTKGENLKGEADILSAAAIPFTVERRVGEIIFLELDTSGLFTTALQATPGFSDIVAKIDGSSYRFNGGFRLDVDKSGVFEAEYDNYYAAISVTNSAATLKGADFVSPGNKGWQVTLSMQPGITGQPFPNEAAYLAAIESGAPYPIGGSPMSQYNFYFWDGQTQSTLSTRFLAAKIELSGLGTPSNTQTDEAKNAYKDVGERIMGGIKLQKLSGTSWTDVKTAEYPTDAFQTVNGTPDYYLFFREVRYDHMGTYRVIWSGDANQRTTSEYFGVRQKIEIKAPASAAVERPYNVTEVTGETNTIVNTNLVRFEADININGHELYSRDIEGKNIVLKFPAPLVGTIQHYWKELPLQDFQNSFKIVHCNKKGDDNCLTLEDENIIFIDIIRVEYKVDITNPVTGRNNIMLVYLDPDYRKNPDPDAKDDIRAFINNGFGHDSGTNSYQGNFVFGSIKSPAYAYDFFEFYEIGAAF